MAITKKLTNRLNSLRRMANDKSSPNEAAIAQRKYKALLVKHGIQIKEPSSTSSFGDARGSAASGAYSGAGERSSQHYTGNERSWQDYEDTLNKARKSSGYYARRESDIDCWECKVNKSQWGKLYCKPCEDAKRANKNKKEEREEPEWRSSASYDIPCKVCGGPTIFFSTCPSCRSPNETGETTEEARNKRYKVIREAKEKADKKEDDLREEIRVEVYERNKKFVLIASACATVVLYFASMAWMFLN
jgi:hypothetical protein